jgi:hypothetical protein
MHSIRLRYPISASPLVGDLDGDGRLEIAVGALSMGLWRLAGEGKPARVIGWPQRGRGPFASSPACADIDGDGLAEIVAGSDDDCLHAWRLDGSRVPGFPFVTGGDVYSSPALADLDGDGRCEIVFGSDDGCVYALDGTGRLLPGWPVRTGGFVSASPVVTDLDGDGRPEVIVGSWDRRLYVIRADGVVWSGLNGHPGWPVTLESVLWSSPLVADMDGDGANEVALASAHLHLLGLDGKDRPGWPQWIGGFTPSSPVAGNLGGRGLRSLVIGGDGLHAFDPAGRPRAGFPLDLGGHVWARPLVRDLDHDGRDEIYVGSWNNAFHGIGHDGRSLPGFPVMTKGPIFGSAGAHDPIVSGEAAPPGAPHLVFGCWDGTLRILQLPLAAAGARGLREEQELRAIDRKPHGIALPPVETIRWSFDPDPPRDHRATFITLHHLPPESVRSALLLYRKPDGVVHPSPFLPTAGKLAGMLEPLPGGSSVEWWLEIEGWDGRILRIPSEGTHGLRIAGDPLRAMVRRVRESVDRALPRGGIRGL